MENNKIRNGITKGYMTQILNDALIKKNISQRKFSKMLGWTPQNFNQRFHKNRFKAEEWVMMMNLLGYKTEIVELPNRKEQSPEEFSQQLQNFTSTAEEWLQIIEMFGYRIKLVDVDSGADFKPRKKGHGRRVKRVIDGVIYDTEKADALCDDFYQDGINEYTDGMAFELFVNSFGDFFIARYVEWENGKDSISTIGKEDAEKLYNKYGCEMLEESMPT